MITKRVLVCSSELLLGASLFRLLDGEVDIDVFGITSSDENTLSNSIQEFHPDIIVYTAPFASGDDNFLGFLCSNHPDIPFITIDSKDNWVHTYAKKDFLLSHASDLVEIIRSH